MLQLAPWRVLGIDKRGEALPQKTARYARTFLGAPFSRRRSQAHATERKDREMTGNPEGESLRGSLIFTTEASVDIYSYQGIKKNRPEPKFKGVCKKSVLIEI